jgi:molybdopterin-guanine dinucleotide biosynthesis protein A
VEFDAVVLAGGRAERLGGADKASLEAAGASLLDRALAAVAGARVVVVVGEERPAATTVPVLWTREHPPYGGPVTATYAGLDALRRHSPVQFRGGEPTQTTESDWTMPSGGLVVVLAVDMPAVTAATVGRLVRAAQGRDGAVLAGGGRRHLAMAVWAPAAERVRPARVEGAAMRGLWASLDLADVAAQGAEAHDVDSEDDLSTLPKVLERPGESRQIGSVNLHDWIDEVCDALDVDVEVDEALLLDLAKVVADNVVRTAAPVTSFILGYAAGLQEADPEGVERLAARAQALAEEWDRPAGAKDPDDIDDAVPDDSAVDHTGDRFDD